MARLTISATFSALCGTEKPQVIGMAVKFTAVGRLVDDFVSRYDDRVLKTELRDQLALLEGKHLDDIVGRATLENIAAYLVYRLKRFSPHTVAVRAGEREVSVDSDDLVWDTFETDLLFSRATSIALRGRLLEAVELYSRVLTAKPAALSFNARGRCRRRLGSIEEALSDFDEAIVHDARFGAAFRNRANVLLERGQGEVALSDFDRAIELMPTSALAWNNRGYCLQRLGRYQEALSDHNRALALEPDYQEAHQDRAAALRSLKRYAEAEPDILAADALAGKAALVEIERFKLNGELNADIRRVIAAIE